MNFFPGRKNIYYRFIIAMLAASFFAAGVTFLAEYGQPESDFTSIVDLFYWWASAMTTVGAGPVISTELGRIAAIITMSTGAVFYLGVFTEIIIWVRNKADQRFSGVDTFKGKNHILIIGYNNLAIGLINLLDQKVRNDIPIVLVTSKIDTNPNPDRVTFVKVNPASAQSLEKVHAADASVAFILNNEDMTDRKADINALLIAGMVEDLQQSVCTLAEVSDTVRAEEYAMFKVDEYFTFEELLKDLQMRDESGGIWHKIPEKIREQLSA